MKKSRLSTGEFWFNKALLGVLLVVLAIFAVIGYTVNIILGAVFLVLFMAVFSMLFEIDKIKQWLDNIFK